MMYHHRRSRSRSRSRELGQMMERSRAHPSYYNRSRSRERQRARDDFHLRPASRPGHSGDNHGRNSQRDRSHSSERSRASDMNSFPRTQGGPRPTGSERVSPSRSSTSQSYKRSMGCCVRCDGCLMLDAPPIDFFFKIQPLIASLGSTILGLPNYCSSLPTPLPAPSWRWLRDKSRLRIVTPANTRVTSGNTASSIREGFFF